MEKIAYKMEDMLQEKLSLYEEILNLLDREKGYIVDMDLDSLWKITEEKQKLARAIESVKERILCLAEQQAVLHESKPGSFHIDGIINTLPVPKYSKSDLKKTKLELDALKEKVSEAAAENKAYVEEYLAVIQDVFSTATEKPQEQKYGSSGSVKQNPYTNHFIRAEV